MFDKTQYLWLDWDEPNPINIFVIILHAIFFLPILFGVAVWWVKIVMNFFNL